MKIFELHFKQITNPVFSSINLACVVSLQLGHLIFTIFIT